MSQLRESTLELPAVGQAASTLDYFPDAEYSHSNTADVTILQRKKCLAEKSTEEPRLSQFSFFKMPF